MLFFVNPDAMFYIIFFFFSFYGIGRTTLCLTMMEVLESHSQHFTHLWEGFIGSKETPRFERFAQNILAKCICYAAFSIYHALLMNLLVCQVCLRWSRCCVHAVPLFTWGWTSLWQTFHLSN